MLLRALLLIACVTACATPAPPKQEAEPRPESKNGAPSKKKRTKSQPKPAFEAAGKEQEVALMNTIDALSKKDLYEDKSGWLQEKAKTPEEKQALVARVKALLEAGADPNAVHFWGQPVEYEASDGQTYLRITVYKSPDFVAAADGGESALTFARRMKLAEVAQLLAKHGAK